MKHVLRDADTPWIRQTYVVLLLLLLLLNYFLAQFDKFILSYFQASVIRDLHLTSTQYGLLSGYATGIVSALSAIPVAFLADYSRSRLWTLCAVAVWWNICVIFQSYSHNFWQIFLARLAMSIGQSPVEALSISLISDYVPSRWLFLTESILYVGVYIGEAVSAQIATAFLKTNTPWTNALRAIAVVGLILAAVLRLVAREPERRILNVVKSTADDALPSQPSPASPHQPRISMRKLLLASVKHVVSMKSFWVLTLSSGARQFSGNVFGFYMPSYLASQFPSNPNLLSNYGIIVGAVGSVAVVLGGLVCSSTPRTPTMALYVTAIGGMLSAPFVICMVFSKRLAGSHAIDATQILYGTMSAAYLTAELWLGAFASLLVSLLPPHIKTVCLAIYTCTIILIYSSAPQMIGLALRNYDVGSDAYIDQTRDILAILIPIGYWLAGIGFLLSINAVNADLDTRRRAETDGYLYHFSRGRKLAFTLFVALLLSLTIALLVTSLVVM